ncbi:tyrosine--tRNA ligase [Mycobacterium heckeshornense]|uniref:Tyrosine--tRNA ligase n=1 Tax=Mycobacterium heckeshornense TaxID=110505 RepID=A0A7R7TVU4_9MYCO|nr:tyrosine--tRNA ligase [Mycobacterium heckeshornense]BCQ09191.1 tyrosine--tRNA ligase [Mycobacterium heckeshornense]
MGAPILDELSWRGLIAQSTDLEALAAEAARGPLTVYAGFDPTAPSLHAGHLVPLLALRRFQRAGHRPIVLAGGATGLIGDPRDTGERALNAADTVLEWTERIRGQLERFVDFDDSPTGAIVENNLEWTRDMSAIEFLRDVGKHFSVNVMLDRDVIRRRLNGEGISYTEFSYLLLQANDYVELYRRHHCVLQIGGSDQWGNIIAGVRLARQKLGVTVHALTVPLVTAADGAKFGKSTGGGNLWLDPEMTTPYAWYQYFINTADADVIRYLRWFTFLSADELADLEEATASRPQDRVAQRTLARELTTLVHGEAVTKAVERASRALFGHGELARLDEATLTAALRETPVAELKPGAPDGIVDLLVASGLSPSKGAARRTIAEGGVSVNNTKVDSDDWTPRPADFLHGRWLVLRRGKRNIAGIERVGRTVRPGGTGSGGRGEQSSQCRR